VGFITTDMGAIVFLLALVLTGFAARRASTLLGRVATVLTTILLVAYGIAVWAMTGKPT
jgi:hypothetical protein